MNKIFPTLLLSMSVLVSCDSSQNTNQSTNASEKKPLSIVQDKPVEQITEPAEEKTTPVTVMAEVKQKQPEPEPEKQPEKKPAVKAGMSGEQVYNNACKNCHATGAAGAPKLEVSANWENRIAKGIDELYLSAINGVPSTAMMPKGTCNKCSDDELIAAVDYMVSKVK